MRPIIRDIALALVGIAPLLAPYVITVRPAHGSEMSITGIAKAKDGDDVVIGILDIRLQGIAAPEDNEMRRDPDGPASTANLKALVDGKTVRCEPDGTRTSKRTGSRPVAVCFLDGKDIGEYQVRSGHALDCPRYSGGHYAKAEADAKADGHDLAKTYARPAYCASR